ncbi:DUF4286 family protein [Microbacterium sp. Leaf159]|uniref:DUF4286 family protein n=1 Tax=Microbacterium sp. Leaf159 TaxID=1736279 RepID=UPI0007019035|nr:DUF4286 family protein [Microbacterium sp. Leaf159]KQR37451.1 hypothetical protein ASF80_16990 [Microbacterium sp. Leaf159]
MNAGVPTGEVIIAFLNAVEGKEDEFNQWYTEQHLPEVVRLDGILAARRYALPAALRGHLPYSYATIYEIEGSAAEAMQRIHTAEYESHSDALDVSSMLMSPFEPFGVAVLPR